MSGDDIDRRRDLNDPEEHALESAGDADISNGTVAISEYTGAIGLFLR